MKKIILTIFAMVLGASLFAQSFTRELKLEQKRMNGKDVAALQNKLVSLGFTSVGEVDGYFGPNTQRAVRAAEHFFGFEANGVVTKDVWNCLFSKDPVNNKIQKIIKHYNSLANQKFDVVKEEYNGHSSEGGEIVVLNLNGKPVVAEAVVYGEYGKYSAMLVEIGDTAGIIIESTTEYAGQFNEGGQHKESTSVTYMIEEAVYTAENGKFIVQDKIPDSEIIVDLMEKFAK